MSDALSAADVLDVWERGRNRHPVDRALLILAAVAPASSTEPLERLPVGERDARLLAVRRATFGDTIESWAECPRCAGVVEFTVSASALAGPGAAPDAVLEIEAGGVSLRLRVPDSVDLASAAGAADAAAARGRLLERCVVATGLDGGLLDVGTLPAAVLDVAEAYLAEVDPRADVTFAVACPLCGHAWELVFDIATILWSEIAAAARRAAQEVHVLARAYGWRETDVLTLSPARRQLYLSLVS